MKRLVVVCGVVLAAVAGGAVYVALGPDGPRREPRALGPQGTPVLLIPRAEPVRGLVYAGLARTPDGACGSGFALASAGLCTHGPDAAPPGIDVTRSRGAAARTAQADVGATVAAGTTTSGSVVCEDDGVGGKRVQAIYARPETEPDRYAELLSSIRLWASWIDGRIDSSAAETGGSRRVRYVTDPACNVVVENVVLSTGAAESFGATIYDLQSKGFSRSDRKYVVWAEANVYCGIGTLRYDDAHSPTNRSNDGPGYSRVDRGCWEGAAAHELLHNFGAVQGSAPHANGGHCNDEHDLMCYGQIASTPCPDLGHDFLFDCGHDDYFSTAPAAGSYLANRWNAADSEFLIATNPTPGRFVPLAPARILDTRTGVGGVATLAGGVPAEVQVLGRGGVPDSGATAVVLNVTVTNPTSGGYVTLYPAGTDRPLASSLNFSGGQTIANLVTVKLGAGGRVAAFLDAGRSDLIFDVAGWFTDDRSAGTGRLRPLEPKRILDTRSGQGGFRTLAPGATIDVTLRARGGLPSWGADAVVLNATVTNPTTEAGYLTIWPTGAERPEASNLNFARGQTVPNRVVVKPGAGMKVSVFNPSGNVDVILDVVGWFSNGWDGSLSGVLEPLVPERILDTRSGLGGVGALTGGSAADVQVSGRGGVPPSGVSAVVMNVTVTNPTTPAGYLTVYPSGVERPTASDLNFVGGQTVPNLVVAKLGEGGRVSVFLNAGRADVIFDVVGWFT